MFEQLAVDLYELNFVTIVLRSFLAILIGGIIGTERDLKSRAAGLRTHMLVCFGSAVVMMTNQYVFDMYPDAGVDPTRMGAQVISGIGFLGAGTILVTNENRIKGLTTAAGLWVAATIGLAIGAGFYGMAAIGGLAILGIVILLRPIKELIQEKMDHTELTLIIQSENGFDEFLRFASSLDLTIVNLEIEKELQPEPDSRSLIFTITFDLSEGIDKDQFIEELKRVKGIRNVVKVRE